MIGKVVIRRFKRFDEVTFDLPGHVVLAGPNNTGKTTVLQAIAAWGLAFDRWRRLNDFQRHGGAYTKAPITRQTFSAVPLRAFDLLWRERTYTGPIEVEIHSTQGWTITIEFIADSTEQIYVRPKPNADPTTVRNAILRPVFVPPMTGLSTDEPVHQLPKIDQLLGQAKPGEVIRNLLLQAHSDIAWEALQASIKRLFGYELLPPNTDGPDILAEYTTQPGGIRLDIASAGSGFQQVLMLLTFLNTHPASVLLLDEPDAHLHVILQDAIYGELRAVAAKQQSQLIIATHSEVIINSVEPRELCVMLHQPRMLADSEDRERLIKSLGALSNEDIMLAMDAPGVLYLEDYTDLEILRAWAKTLAHPAYELLTTRLFWKKTVFQPRAGAAGIAAREHYDALKLVRDDLPGLELLHGDARPEIPPTPITGQGLQRLRWKRYEIESYLLHPDALARYVEQIVGSGAASLHVQDLRKHFEETYPPAFLRDPLNDLPLLLGTKARTLLIPPALDAAGLPSIPYTRYHEIAAVMKPEEIHPEVVEKLNAIQKAFGL
ncbi:MAG: AAA family ATPase [Deltaproteobacteria bacterium]|nr:AAA family ATPase [Deltaproteobacteria bacterium]